LASTINLERTIKLAQRYVRNAPLTFVNDGDPAFSAADSVRQFILSPPFAWRWNRSTVSPLITCAPGKQDYTVSAGNFGWIERAVLNFPIVVQSGAPQSIELEVKMDLGIESTPNQPTQIAAINDDNNGNITFRLSPPPEQAYTINIIYQRSALTFGSTQDFWTPIPDYLSYLYNLGMRAAAYEYLGDERYGFSYQMFLRQVLAANDGLTETQKNIFLEHTIITQVEQQNAQGMAQGGRAGRGGV
jgi:hypothetical protein